MIKVENIETYGWEAAIRGMRNVFVIGKNDLDLMQRLYKGGTEHRKGE